MFVRDSSAAAEPPPLSAHSPKHGERPACWTDPKSANGTNRHSHALNQRPLLGVKRTWVGHIYDATSSFCPSLQNAQRKGNCMSTNDTYLAVFRGSKTSPKIMAWNSLPEAERR